MGGNDDCSFCLLGGQIDITMHTAYLSSFPVYPSIAYTRTLSYNLCMFGSVIGTTLMNKVNGAQVV